MHVTTVEVKDFSECCHNIYLTKIPWRGDYFTWTNRQQGDARVCSRIDRILGNDIWMMKYVHLVTDYEEPYISYHNLMTTAIRNSVTRIKYPFRFSNVWASHIIFQSLVTVGWRKHKALDKMKNIWFKIKDLKVQFKHLNAAEFKRVTERIDQARMSLNQIQSQMQTNYSDALLDQEKEWRHKLETWSLLEAEEVDH